MKQIYFDWEAEKYRILVHTLTQALNEQTNVQGSWSFLHVLELPTAENPHSAGD